MKVGTLVGLILVVAGLVGVAFGGFTYTRRREVVRAGPIEVTAKEQQHVPISAILGGAVIIAGLALIVAVKRPK